jgi:hypothetical protein
MSPRDDGIPSALRLWISRILWQRRNVIFSIFGVIVVGLFLLVSPPDFDIRSSILPRPWHPHIPFDDTTYLPKHPAGDKVWAERAHAVKRAFIHAYERYESIAFPFDELLPMTNRSVNKQVSHSRGSNAAILAADPLNLCPCYKLTHFSNSFNGWGVTAIDSLDTMILMGLKPQAERVIEHIAKLDFKGAHVRSVLQISTFSPLIWLDSDRPRRTSRPLLDTLEAYFPHTT